ncbi:SRPBCC family protein [Nocardioides solisilvae]|uniref:SRPBCC family protein n=1 Tax=Nocardioides solisilvae TaxID=1542435 RepID=UPI000D74E9F2|nr:SRPBCC family protein [Nocardioides solisilvae]
MAPTFVFSGRWRVPATVAEVAGVLVDLEHYPRWWPEVRAVARLDDDTARVLCRSILPYTLDLVLRAERREPPVLRVGVDGDLAGTVAFELVPAGAGTEVRLSQEVVLAHRSLAVVAGPAGPLLRWNHRRMMAGFARGLVDRLGEAGPGQPRAAMAAS